MTRCVSAVRETMPSVAGPGAEITQGVTVA